MAMVLSALISAVVTFAINIFKAFADSKQQSKFYSSKLKIEKATDVWAAIDNLGKKLRKYYRIVSTSKSSCDLMEHEEIEILINDVPPEINNLMRTTSYYPRLSKQAQSINTNFGELEKSIFALSRCKRDFEKTAKYMKIEENIFSMTEILGQMQRKLEEIISKEVTKLDK